jgi:hypothetical protein
MDAVMNIEDYILTPDQARRQMAVPPLAYEDAFPQVQRKSLWRNGIQRLLDGLLSRLGLCGHA